MDGLSNSANNANGFAVKGMGSEEGRAGEANAQLSQLMNASTLGARGLEPATLVNPAGAGGAVSGRGRMLGRDPAESASLVARSA